MTSAVLLCTLYVLLLFGLTKLFGVKYPDIFKSTRNIQRGIVYPIGIATVLLSVYAVLADWLPRVMTFQPKESSWFLWIIPLVTAVTILARFSLAKPKLFDRQGIALLIAGAVIVGFSEELVVRGITVTSLQDAGFTTLWIGVISSCLFGLLHLINYFTGQTLAKTGIQVAGTVLMGLNFYILLVITGQLWVPMVFHALYDLSIFMLGPDAKIPEGFIAKVISVTTLGMFLLPVVGLFFL